MLTISNVIETKSTWQNKTPNTHELNKGNKEVIQRQVEDESDRKIKREKRVF